MSPTLTPVEHNKPLSKTALLPLQYLRSMNVNRSKNPTGEKDSSGRANSDVQEDSGVGKKKREKRRAAWNP